MKRILPLLFVLGLLTGCAVNPPAETTEAPTTVTTCAPSETEDRSAATESSDGQTRIFLSGSEISVTGENAGAVFSSHDIIYYEDRDAYDSGNPYGEGTDADKHTAQEAAAHTVVNITQPGTYRVSGKLSAGQIRVDLGEDARDDPDAVVTLVLEDADITCTVAPAILFLNVYECDGDRDAENATAEVDTSAAGAVLVLEGNNTVCGSYVARIYKDQAEEKKLWKQDGAIYSYMSMNVEGPGNLDLTAENEGLDTELHLTVNGGNIAIRSQNDGINTNEDGVSVTTINGGTLHIIAGLGEEGDGIDSNGYLVINGGTVVSAANPASDAGLDSDLGSYVNGGTVIALGSTMDWAESDSRQVTMNLQFAQYQSGNSAVVVTREDGTVIFAYDPGEDEIMGENTRQYQGAVISCGNFREGETYLVFTDGTVTGTNQGGVYDITTVAAYTDGIQMMYTGTDVGRGGPGGNRPGGQKPDDTDRTPPPDLPDDRPVMPEGETPPEGEMPSAPDGEMPEGFAGDENVPAPPDDRDGRGGFDPAQAGNASGDPSQEGSLLFYMNDKVNAFSGITAAAM